MKPNIIPYQLVQEVKQRTDLIQVVQRYIPLGRTLKACCPFHSEKTPSFSINLKKRYWHCFGCGRKGDIFTFIQLIENISFHNAVQFLAGEVGISFPKSERYKSFLRESRKLQQEKLLRFEQAKRSLKMMDFKRRDELLAERLKLYREQPFTEWNSKDYLKNQLIDYRFDLLKAKMVTIDAQFHEETERIQKNG